MPDDTNKKTVADRIRELRVSQGLTQMDLAKRIGKKDKSSICKIEGKKNDITLKDVARVAEALGTTPAYLMGWEEEEQERIFNEEMAGFLVEIRKDPNLRELVRLLSRLSRYQQANLLSFVRSMQPDEHPEQGRTNNQECN